MVRIPLRNPMHARRPVRDPARGALRDRLSDEAWPRRLLFLFVAAVLVAVPITVDSARAKSFSALVEAFPLPTGNMAPITLEGVRALLSSAHVQRAIEDNVRPAELTDEVRHVSVNPGPRPKTMWISGSAASPATAVSLTNVAGEHLAAAATQTMLRQTLATLTIMLGRSVPRGTAARVAHVARIGRLKAVLARQPPRLVLGPRPGLPRGRGWGDGLVRAMGLPISPRPNVAAGALVGLGVAVALWLVALWRWPPRARPRGEAEAVYERPGGGAAGSAPSARRSAS